VRKQETHELVTTGTTPSTGHSLRDGVTAYFVLSPVTGSFATVVCGNSFRKLDASVGASGPHDFAVHASSVRLTRYHVHRILHPTFVTIAKRPLRVRTRESVELIYPTAQGEYFCEGGLDDPNHVESSHKIRFCAHAISLAFYAANEATAGKLN
jgi:hypothetical protein